MRKELPKADPAMQNPKLLEKVLQAVEERMLESERQGKILTVNSEFFKLPNPSQPHPNRTKNPGTKQNQRTRTLNRSRRN